ncbi:hypothetical protein SMACR_03577 [Sordaria macrospora]|uniref:Uncharacterized protein n=1 Tax=Sordaria macrospora TaxID=5147 RepID=A0A8S9A3V4_SORMA|nr:hypothetical protein SMACR_03577 [Sordaria macrospora]WPJ65972.1 hypothetical protein SMAC4_03577 [Sordaria macrospora]
MDERFVRVLGRGFLALPSWVMSGTLTTEYRIPLSGLLSRPTSNNELLSFKFGSSNQSTITPPLPSCIKQQQKHHHRRPTTTCAPSDSPRWSAVARSPSTVPASSATMPNPGASTRTARSLCGWKTAPSQSLLPISALSTSARMHASTRAQSFWKTRRGSEEY